MIDSIINSNWLLVERLQNARGIPSAEAWFQEFMFNAKIFFLFSSSCAMGQIEPRQLFNLPGADQYDMTSCLKIRFHEKA
ncbi:hypothetical protein JOE11_005567 [Robbsia andropogonis]|uniref:hypothetical protein n=1 Tax=Robbsia andropogonis TaxID=28092 RepID=UPI0020A17948|nr:hypothetical protein [Robbsia andropogonis]MCP1121229.1 hypothetical protein [Robbsia andropogonis]MCP1131019.1 hypothetical protein [Robbsia andropogonis]